jgi:hypothetical protein
MRIEIHLAGNVEKYCISTGVPVPGNIKILIYKPVKEKKKIFYVTGKNKT